MVGIRICSMIRRYWLWYMLIKFRQDGGYLFDDPTILVGVPVSELGKEVVDDLIPLFDLRRGTVLTSLSAGPDVVQLSNHLPGLRTLALLGLSEAFHQKINGLLVPHQLVNSISCYVFDACVFGHFAKITVR